MIKENVFSNGITWQALPTSFFKLTTPSFEEKLSDPKGKDFKIQVFFLTFFNSFSTKFIRTILLKRLVSHANNFLRIDVHLT